MTRMSQTERSWNERIRTDGPNRKERPMPSLEAAVVKCRETPAVFSRIPDRESGLGRIRERILERQYEG